MAEKKGLTAIRIRADAPLQAIYGKPELKATDLLKGISAYANEHDLKTRGEGKGLAALQVKTDANLKAVYGDVPVVKWFDLMKGMWAYIKKNNLRTK